MQISKTGGAMKFQLSSAVAAIFATMALCAASGHAAVLLVDSLADDVFPDEAGAIFDVSGNPIVLASQKCTLRMAIAASNIDAPVGGATGCNAQGASTFAMGGGDNINFATALAGGTILLDANKGMVVTTGGIDSSILWISGPVSLDGSAGTASRITLDAAATSTTNRRILRVQELVSSTTESPARSTWTQILSMNLRNSRMQGGGGCAVVYESVRLIDMEFSNCEGAVGLAGALLV